MNTLVTLASALTLACLTLVSGADDLVFTAPPANDTLASHAPFKKIKIAATFGSNGARMTICPSGDCVAGQTISLALSRLEEIDFANKVVA